MDVDTMKNMLIQAMYTIFLGGHNRSMLLGVSLMLRNADGIRLQRTPLEQTGERTTMEGKKRKGTCVNAMEHLVRVDENMYRISYKIVYSLTRNK